MVGLWFESREESLSVRQFGVREGISSLFEVAVTAVSPHSDLDLDAMVGHAAAFRLDSGLSHGTAAARVMCGPPLKLCGSSRILEGANQNKSPTEIRDVHYIQKFAGAKWG